MQGISRKNCVGFAKFNMAGRQAAAQIVIIHRRQIIMHQGVGMNAFDRRGRSIQRGTAHAEHLAGGVDKEGTQAFTA